MDDILAGESDNEELSTNSLPALQNLDSAPLESANVFTEDSTDSTPASDCRLQKPASLCHDEALKVSVLRPQKVGEGMSAYIIYTVSHTTKLPQFNSSGGGGSVTHRFSDFLSLWERLRDRYAKEGIVLPPRPEKSIIGAAKVKIGGGGGSGGSSVANDDEFLERRRGELERFIIYCCEHPRLRLDADLRDFIQRPGAPSGSSGAGQSGSGLGGALRALSAAVASGSGSLTGKIDQEDDPWFEELHCRLQQQESSLRPWYLAASRLATNRREYSKQAHHLAGSLAHLGATETPSGTSELPVATDDDTDGCQSVRLMRAFSRLADTKDRIASLQAAQAECELAELCEQLRHHLALLDSLRSACLERRRLRRCQADAESALARRREDRAKLERAGRVVAACEAQIKEAEAAVDRSRSEFESASASIKRESDRIDLLRGFELRSAVLCTLEHQLLQQQQVLDAWLNFLPEARKIQSTENVAPTDE